MQTHELELDVEAQATARARRFVRAALSAVQPDLVADAELVVTELVTNAQLHGTGPISLRAAWLDPCVLVEVQDAGRHLPVMPAHSIDAMTGRGLGLVASLSSAWGVRPVPAGAGKVVWAELGGLTDDAPDVDLEQLLAAWPDEERTEPEFTVRLGSVPTDLLLEAKRHIDNVVRELTLERGSSERGPLAPGIQSLIDTVTNDFAGARAAIKRQAVAAAARGEEVTELVLTLPASAAAAGERYLAALDDADRYSRAARLLTLETPLLHRVFRHWYVTQLIEQLRARAAGADVKPPRPFVRVLSDEFVGLAPLRETADRLLLLQAVNSDLTGARSEHDIAAVVSRHATEWLGAASATVYLLDGEVLKAVHSRGEEARESQRWEEVPLTDDWPAAVAFRNGQPLLLRSLTQMTERFPVLGRVYDSDCLLHVVPLIVGEHRLGVLSLTFPPRGDLDEETQSRFVQALADALAQAMERALAVEEAASAAERLAFLAHASLVLTTSLDFEHTVEAVPKLVVPRLADWCTLSLVVDGALTTVAIAHSEPSCVEWAWDLVRASPGRVVAEHGDAHVLRTGISEIYTQVPKARQEAAAVDDGHLRLLREIGMRSAMAVPLPGRDGIIGVLNVVYAESGRRYTRGDVAFLEDVARRAALAVEAARLLRDQSGRLASVSRVAEAAQKAILAPPPATVGRSALAARYISAATDARVGGDLYEAVARDGAVRLLIGDVRGKGLAAVRTATIVLGQFRASAAELDDLGDVARQVDLRVRPYLGEEDFITALLAEICDDGTYRIANCGHPNAILATGHGICLLPTQPTLPLGLGADPAVLTGRLSAKDRLLLYTDGLLEARAADGAFIDLMRIARPLDSGSLETVLDDVLDALTDQVGEELGDDLALLVAEYQG